MTSDTPDLFPTVDLFEDDAIPEGPDEMSRLMAAIDALRDSGTGIWQMMGGKVREPSRSDPFKPEGEWISLAEDLWTQAV